MVKLTYHKRPMGHIMSTLLSYEAFPSKNKLELKHICQKQYYLPLEKGVALHLIKHESPLPNNALCKVWLKLA